MEMKLMIIWIIMLALTLLTLFIRYIYSVIREMKFAEKIKSCEISDFNIETKEIIIKRLKDYIILNKELIRPLQGEDYYNLDISVRINEQYDNWIYLDDDIYKKIHKVSLKTYKAYKKATKGCEYIELKAYSLTLSLKDTKKSLFNGKVQMLRANIPYICPCKAYTDEEINEFVERSKREIIKKVCNRI